jgi:HSP20 family protein
MSFYIDDLFTIPIIRNPFSDLLDLRRQMLDVFDSHIPPQLESSSSLSSSSNKEGESSTSIKKIEDKSGSIQRWNPRCDVEEQEKEIIVRAELPGLKKEEVKIEYDEKRGILTILGEKKHEKEEEKETPEGKYHCIERRYGSFERSFRLPEACKSKIDEITAASVDGVLEIHCPKDEKPITTKKKNIEIK